MKKNLKYNNMTKEQTIQNKATLRNESTKKTFQKKATSEKINEESQIDQPITIPLLLMFGIPSAIAILFMNTLGIVDGIFAMRILGEMPMAAISALNPLLMLVMAIGIMFAAGGSALALKKVGMGLHKEARQIFTLLTVVATTISVIVAAFALVFPEITLQLLGVNAEFIEYAKPYLAIFAYSIPLVVLSQMFNLFIIGDGKPMLGMGISLLGSVLSGGLNAIFLLAFNWGIEALGWASLIGFTVPVMIGFYYFSNNKKGTLYFTFPRWNMKAVGVSLLNGLSAGVVVMAMAAITIVLNNVLVRIDGVGALGVAIAGMVMAVHTTIATVFMGYLEGVGPFISFNHGSKNHDRQRTLFKYNLQILAILTVILVGGAFMFSNALMSIYVPVDTEIHKMAVYGFRIASLSLIFLGFNTFASAHFSSLNKGGLAGLLSAVRLFGINLPMLIILPGMFELTGVWMAWPVAEGLSILITMIVLLKNGKKYNYLQFSKEQKALMKKELIAH